MKTCPYCAEEIQDAAILCRYCGSDLAPGTVALVTQGLTRKTMETDPPNAAEAPFNVWAPIDPKLLPPHSKSKKPIWKTALIVFVVFTVLQVIAQLSTLSDGYVNMDEFLGHLFYAPIISMIAAVIVAVMIAIWRAMASTHN